MNMAFQEPKCVINMGMGADAGLAEVPEARFIRDMAAGFMSTMEGIDGMEGIDEGVEGMGIFMPGIDVSWADSVASSSANGIIAFIKSPVIWFVRMLTHGGSVRERLDFEKEGRFGGRLILDYREVE
jgi:hypothetical protein